jgi:flagellar biosynthetic protein FliP
MNIASLLGVVGVLGFVLTLLIITLKLLKRYAPFASGANQRVKLEIVQRVPLGPRQSIAVVRIGEEYVAVSVGDGGVRRIADVAMKTVALVLMLAVGAHALDAQQAKTAPKPAVKTMSADTMLAKLAPRLDLRVGNENAGGLRLSGTVGIVVMMGLLTLLPTLVLMMTGFTRIFIVLGFLRQALGTQSSPPPQLVAGLALLLTGFVMAPTLEEVNKTAIQPWMDGKIEQSAMLTEGVKPFRAFMLRQTREHDLATFMDLSRQPRVARPEDVPLVVLTSAFVTSELRTSFQIGFALFLPFIVIDVVVASVLMSMGMMMLPPVMISLPFKLLLFVLVDGWTLVINGLIQSFH